MLSTAMQHDADGLKQTYMNFVAHQRQNKQPLQTFANLHKYVLDYVQILNLTNPLVSPPHQAHYSDSFPSNSNSDDEVVMMSAYLSNLGCDNDMLHRFEVLASQQQRRLPCRQQPRAPLNPATEICSPFWGGVPSTFRSEWRKLTKAQRVGIKDNFQSTTPTMKNKDLPTLRKSAYLSYMDLDLSENNSSTGDDGYDTPYKSAMQVYNATSNDALLSLMLHPVPSNYQEFEQAFSDNNASATASSPVLPHIPRVK